MIAGIVHFRVLPTRREDAYSMRVGTQGLRATNRASRAWASSLPLAIGQRQAAGWIGIGPVLELLMSNLQAGGMLVGIDPKWALFHGGL
jgi:hypothetical protein